MKELDKKVNFNEEGDVVITRTTEEVLTLEQLEYRIRDIDRRKQDLVRQSVEIKKQYDEAVKEQQEFESLIAQRESEKNTLGNTEPTVIDPNIQ